MRRRLLFTSALSAIPAFLIACLISPSLAFAELPALSGSLSQKGSILQGGLITAQLPDGATATLDNKSLVISANNHIAFGFHRDDSAPQMLQIILADGRVMLTRLTPQKRSYKTQSITGLAGKYVSPPQKVLDRIATDRANVATARDALSRQDDFAKNGFDWPLRGTITGVYGSQRILNGKPRAPHYGIDIAAPKGAPVTAPADGIVTLADDLYYTGGTLIIDHGLMVSSTLLHLETLNVTLGDKVTRGMVIGTVGSTGRSTGPHLDWRINWHQKRLDPELAAPIEK